MKLIDISKEVSILKELYKIKPLRVGALIKIKNEISLLETKIKQLQKLK